MPTGMGLARVFRVCLVLAGISYGAWHLYNHLLQPDEIKRRVQDAFAEKFEGVDVEVGSARLRPFLGGINISDLKFIRRDDPTRTPFLSISSATIWIDKAEMGRQQVAPSKIELDEVRCNLIRNNEGKWNVEGMQKKKKDSNPSPLMVIKKAHVDVLDEATNHRAQFDLKDLEVTVVNDPVSTFTVEAKGTSHPIGPFHAKLKYEVDTLATGSLELKGIKLGDDLARMVGMAIPEAGEMAKSLTGLGNARVRFAWKPNQPIQYESDFNLSDGRYQLPNLPTVLEDIRVAMRSKNGNLTVDTFTARLDKAALSAKVEIDGPGKGNVPIEERIRKISVVINGLMVNDDLFKMLPANCSSIQEMFSPQGKADIIFEQTLEADGFHRNCTVRPQGMTASYRGFVYPIDNLSGSVEAIFKKDQSPRFLVKLHGEGSGNPVHLEGTIVGSEDDEDHAVDLLLRGEHVVLDEMLIKALPDKYPNFVRSLHATATGDFTAKLRHNPQTRRDYGPKVFDNEFKIQIRQGTMHYDEFRYPLSQIKGMLLIRTVPDHPTIQPGLADQPGQPDNRVDGSVQFQDFTANGPSGCELEINGCKEPNNKGMVLKLDIKGNRVPLNGELQKAISSLRLDNTWKLFDPSATMNCVIKVQIQDYPGKEGEPPPLFYPARDLELKLAFNGPTLQPSFFDYQLTDCQGLVKFEKGVVTMWNFQARHGPSTIKIPNTVVELPPREPGKYYANLWNISVDPMVFDADLLKAMPKGVRQACQELDFKGPFAIHAKHIHVSNTKDPQQFNPANDRLAQNAIKLPVAARGSIPTDSEIMPTIAWDGTLHFRDASFRTGIEWQKVTGQYSSEGIFLGDRLGPVKSNLAIKKAWILKQPVEEISAHFEVDPSQPQIVTVPWIRAQMYGGQIGGEARLQLDSPLRFDLSLNGSRMRLEEFAKVNQLGPKSQVEGIANTQIMLSNPIDPKTKLPVLQGSGWLDIPEGRLLDLPVILDVLKLARLRPMDRTMFEEAHAIFRIRGDRIRFGQLDLIGNALSLGGEGEMNLNGTDANFEFYTVWTNIRNILGVSGEIPSRVSSNLYKIRVSGDLGKGQPKVIQEPLPVLMDPVKRLLGQHRP